MPSKAKPSIAASPVSSETIRSASYLDTDLLREHHKRLFHYLRLSLTGHGIIAVLLLLWSFFFASKPLLIQPSIQVDLVALPDFTKNQANTVDTSLPVKETMKTPSTPLEVPAPTPDMMVLQREEEKKRKENAKEKPEAKTEESAKSALERLKKDLAKKEKLEREQLLEKKKQELSKFDERFRQKLAGNTVSQGNNISGTSGEVLNQYLGHVTDRIRANWELPPYLQSSNNRASVRMFIENDGSIRFFLSKPSGNEIFDNLVRDAINRAKPFAPPPSELAGELKRNGVEVLFPL